MSSRPVFIVSNDIPFVKKYNIEFKFYNGFSISQKQKSIESLHSAFKIKYPKHEILEISTKSPDELGVRLSAFNLMIKTDSGKEFSVENAFQSSKVFQNGGPFKDILKKTPREAKKDSRLKDSGELIYFSFKNYTFNLKPRTYFYDWLYINALNLNEDIKDKVVKYSAFTDIEFNPNKSINCQARAVAVYVSLVKADLIDSALKNSQSFLKIVYGKQNNKISSKQLNLLDND